MCGRFTLKTPAAQWLPHFGIQHGADLNLRYNIAPTQSVATVVNRQGQRTLAEMRWGLIPFWAKDKSIASRLINARAETVASKPAFRASFKSRRCLIIADGFYEWLSTDHGKQPVYIRLRNEQPFAFAGLWDHWKNEEDEAIESCTIITTHANSLLEEVHARMPVMLDDRVYDLWLDEELHDKQRLEELLQPYPAREMKYSPVSQTVNSPRNDSPECIAGAN
jgi:putative SOS response-associated peptidase YedK